jgi:trimethylamine--corrinoid protein Co-methyltransferase
MCAFQSDRMPPLRITVLQAADCARIHDCACRVLEGTGIVLHHEPTRKMLASHDAMVDEGRRLVQIPRRLVDEALAAAPHRLTLHGGAALQRQCILGEGGEGYTRTGSGLNWIVDRGAREHRLVVPTDLDHWVRVVDALPHIHIAGALYDNEYPPQAADVRSVAQLLRRTAKPLMMSAMSGEAMRWIKRLLDVVQPDERPQRLMMLSSVNSPLTYGAGQLEAALVAAELGIPVVINSSAVTGITAPVTLAGSLVQMHAEMLAALTIVQLHQPGAAVVYSGHPVVADLRNGMAAMGTPEVGLLQAGCVELARYCDLPAGSDGLTADSCLPDQMAVSEKWASAFLGLLAGAHVNGAAGAFATQSTVSLEQLVLDDEMYAVMFRMQRGFTVSDETLAAGVIERVGAGGSFLMEEHTVAHMRSELWTPRLAVRQGAAAWQAAGSKDTMQRAGAMVDAILAKRPDAYLTDDQEREVASLVTVAESALQSVEIPV